jgi:hypothetical protein
LHKATLLYLPPLLLLLLTGPQLQPLAVLELSALLLELICCCLSLSRCYCLLLFPLLQQLLDLPLG